MKEHDDFNPNDLVMLLTEPKDTGHLTMGAIVVFGIVLTMHWVGIVTVDMFWPDARDFEERKYQCGDINEKWVQAANTNP